VLPRGEDVGCAGKDHAVVALDDGGCAEGHRCDVVVLRVVRRGLEPLRGVQNLLVLAVLHGLFCDGHFLGHRARHDALGAADDDGVGTHCLSGRLLREEGRSRRLHVVLVAVLHRGDGADFVLAHAALVLGQVLGGDATEGLLYALPDCVFCDEGCHGLNDASDFVDGEVTFPVRLGRVVLHAGESDLRDVAEAQLPRAGCGLPTIGAVRRWAVGDVPALASDRASGIGNEVDALANLGSGSRARGFRRRNGQREELVENRDAEQDGRERVVLRDGARVRGCGRQVVALPRHTVIAQVVGD